MLRQFILVCSAMALLVSCNNNDAEGFAKSENGVLYKFHKQNKEGATAKEGDIVTIMYTFKTKVNGKDSILIDTKRNAPNGEFQMALPKPTFKGSMEEGMMMMRTGDSATFKFPVDSFFLKTNKAEKLAPEFKAGESMYFTVKLISIKNKADYEKEMQEKQKQAQEAAMVAEKEEGNKIEAYLKANNINTKPTASGLIVIEKVKGNGNQVKLNDLASVDYTGKLLDGSIFDSSKNAGKPLEFVVGSQNIIPAFSEALQLLKIGSEATIICPSKIAYGGSDMGQIPPFSTLVFDIKVVDAKSNPTPAK
jgi:FKBP-type peptidyl-prolyl cis-trans isomerase FkpA